MIENVLLLFNLGFLDLIWVEDVCCYFDQFFMDFYVVDLFWLLWCLLVLLILIKCLVELVYVYSLIWWDEGLLLIVFSCCLQEVMKLYWLYGLVELVMCYGQLVIEKVLFDLVCCGIWWVILVLLYLQFVDSIMIIVEQEVCWVIVVYCLGLEVSMLLLFYDQLVYFDVLVESVCLYLQQFYDYLLLSFYGLFEWYICKLVKDFVYDLLVENSCNVSFEVFVFCYCSQCLCIVEVFVECVGLEQGCWLVLFQLCLGCVKWIEFYIDVKFDELVQCGVKCLLVMCLVFVVDCIEILEEIGMCGCEQFISVGGEDLVLIFCFNDYFVWVGVLVEMSGCLVRLF